MKKNLKRITNFTLALLFVVLGVANVSYASIPIGDPTEKVQVKYDIEHLDIETNENIKGYTVTKMDFLGNTVVEKAEEFDGYILNDEIDTKELLLQNGERQKIEFYYIKVSSLPETHILNVTKKEALEEIDGLVWLSEEAREEYKNEIDSLTDIEKINEVLEAAKNQKIQIVYNVDYLEKDTDNNLQGYTTTKIDFAGNTVVEKAEKFDGYVLDSSDTQELLLIDGERQTIVFYYTKLEDIPADSELNIAKEAATDEISGLKWLKEDEKNDYITGVEKATLVSDVNAILEEAKNKNHYAIPQVKYNYVCIDSDGEEFYSITKMDFADNTVIEKAYVDRDYILLSEKEQALKLEADNENTVEFRYVKKSLMLRELDALKYLGDDKAALLEELDSLSGEANVEAFLEKAAEINKNNAPKVLYTLKYIDADNGEVLKQTEEMEGIVEDVLELDVIEGYAFSNPQNGKYQLQEDDNSEIVIELVQYNDDEDIDTFLAKRMNYDSKLVYKNTNFTGRENALIDYVTKAVYNRDLYVKFTATEEELDAVYGKLFNRPNRGGNFRFVRHWPSKSDVLEDGEAVPESDNSEEKVFTIGLTYDCTKEDMQATEDLLVAFVENNITEDMSDFDKVKLIHDYVLYKGEMAITEVDDPNGEHKSIINLPSGRMSNNTVAIMLDGEGICEGYSMLFSRLCELSGIESKFVNGYSGNPATPKATRDYYRKYFARSKSPWRLYNHSWNQLKIDGEWYNVDVYYEKYFSKYYPHMKQEYARFLKSDDYFKNVEFRIWEEAITENCEKDYYKDIYAITLKPQTDFVE